MLSRLSRLSRVISALPMLFLSIPIFTILLFVYYPDPIRYILFPPDTLIGCPFLILSVKQRPDPTQETPESQETPEQK